MTAQDDKTKRSVLVLVLVLVLVGGARRPRDILGLFCALCATPPLGKFTSVGKELGLCALGVTLSLGKLTPEGTEHRLCLLGVTLPLAVRGVSR